jgi:Predicted membrane protein/domain
MKKVNVVLRILAMVVDVIVIMLPIQFIMIGVFGVSMRQAEFFFQVLFAVYGVLVTEYQGATLGKIFAKTTVVDVTGNKPVIMYVGLRELTKTMYFIPWIGWVVCAISVIMVLIRKDGRTLHDFVGNTQVIYRSSKVEQEKEYDDE